IHGAVNSAATSDVDHACCRTKTALDVQRFPRALFFIFAETEGVLGRLTDRRLVEYAGNCSADVGHDQTQGPADGRIGAPSLAEDIRAAVDLQALAAWTIDN